MTLFRPATFLMVQYAHYHRDRRNIATHLVGIPLIFLAIGVLLLQPSWHIDGHDVSLAWWAWAVTSVWYLTRGDLLLGLATTLVNAALIALAHQVPEWSAIWGLPVWQIGVALFVIGWLFQFVGHYLEGRKPAFVDDVVGLLVGPMFVVGEVLIVMGLLKKMRRDIERQAGPTH